MTVSTLPYPEVNKSSYRADIDGLRGLQILALIGFHGFPQWVTGGYIGVSIFFVISGYLISTIIYKSLRAKNTIDFKDFYIRRTRRIFPALALILISSVTLGWLLMLPNEYKQLSEYVMGGAGFLDNFIAWDQIGYFDEKAELKPLLHLWSLGIEEQFYLFWPVTLWIGWKCRINILWLTVMLTLFSFAIGSYMLAENSPGSYYAPWARIWEILAGGVLAYIHFNYPKARLEDKRSIQNIFSLTGLIILFFGIFFYTKQTPFPGIHALVPVGGALLIIAGGEVSWVNKHILSNKLMVWFGVISYPLYLWHWMLISFTRVVNGGESPAIDRFLAIIISVLLAWGTYRLVENPFRFGKKGLIKSILLIFGLFLCAAIGFFIYFYQGVPNRAAALPLSLYEGDIGHDEFHRYPYKGFKLCTPLQLRSHALKWTGGEIRCFQSTDSKPIDIAIIGDSHAEQIFLGLAEQFTNKNIVYYIKGGKPFLSNPEFRDIFFHVENEKNISAVIYTGWWADIFKGDTANLDKAYHDLDETVKFLSAAGKKIYITDDIPNFSFDPKQCKYSRRFSSRDGCYEKNIDFNERYRIYYGYLKKIAENNKSVRLISTVKYFCKDGICSMKNKDLLLYRDFHHLNISGSKYLGENLMSDYGKLFDDGLNN